MTNDNPVNLPARQPKPESLEAKFKLLQLLPYDARAKRKHCLVFGFILDWYHSKYGDALASVRHIVNITKERDPAGKGLYAGDIHKALTDLVSWGYLDQEKGVGRKASRYVPIWEKLASVHKTPNTTENEISVRENTNTCVRENTNTADISVRSFTNEDPSTPTRSTDQGTGVDIDMHCALPVAGLGAAPAIAKGEGDSPFHKLWLAYGVKKSLAEAEAEFAKREWDMEELLASATAWREAWEAQKNPDAPRKRLHVWLRDRHYMEDPPTAYMKKERASVQKPAKPAVADNDNDHITKPSVWIGDVGPFSPEGTFETELHDCDIVQTSDSEVEVRLKMDIQSGDIITDVTHTLFWESQDEKKKRRGRDLFYDIARCVGVTVNDDLDTDSLLFKPFRCTITNRGAISYEPHPENDQQAA